MKTDIVNDFLVYVIEEYKFLEHKTAKEVMVLFTEYNVFNYITQNYPALHTMGGRAIVDDINSLMENKCPVKQLST
jgi:hypothetical protein